MHVHFTPEQEARLSEMAQQTGTDAEQWVHDAVLQRLDEDARFRAAVQQGIEAADRGEFVEHDEVWARVEKILEA